MRNPKDLKVKIYPAGATYANIAEMKAQGPSRSDTTSSKHNGKPRHMSKGSNLSRSLSTRDGRVSPMQEPLSPCGSNRDSLVWALDENAPRSKRVQSDPPQLPAHRMRTSAELFSFQVAQGLPDNIGFKQASKVPHPQQPARASSKRTHQPRPAEHNRGHQNAHSTENWTNIPLEDSRNKPAAPQRPHRAAPARHHNNGVYAMHPVAEAGAVRGHQQSRHKDPLTEKFVDRKPRLATGIIILIAIVLCLLVIGIIFAVVKATNK